MASAVACGRAIGLGFGDSHARFIHDQGAKRPVAASACFGGEADRVPQVLRFIVLQDQAQFGTRSDLGGRKLELKSASARGLPFRPNTAATSSTWFCKSRRLIAPRPS